MAEEKVESKVQETEEKRIPVVIPPNRHERRKRAKLARREATKEKLEQKKRGN